MCPDDTNGVPPQEGHSGEAVEGSASAPSQPLDAETRSAIDAALSTSSFFRRTFLKAAALGTAAAALGEGLGLGARLAFANDLSGNPCTAQDVTVDPQAVVLNEECACTGTFSAQVQFTV